MRGALNVSSDSRALEGPSLAMARGGGLRRGSSLVLMVLMVLTVLTLDAVEAMLEVERFLL
jgi:hypothetical protein